MCPAAAAAETILNLEGMIVNYKIQKQVTIKTGRWIRLYSHIDLQVETIFGEWYDPVNGFLL